MAKVKKLVEANILSFLANDSLNTSDNDDPISSQMIKVTLDQLQAYELNPRRTRNPKYDDIKSSIESVGLLEPPKITRRHPDDEKYSIRNGGNTRLEVLNDLYAQYTELARKEKDKAKKQILLDKADSFYRISCVFVPFQDDLNALSTHMIENEERGGTIFIERALVVERYKKLFKELDGQEAIISGEEFEYKPLSSRILAERISSYGWQMSQSHIVRYNYAATTLINYIPDALWAGAGEPLARKLSTLFKAYDIFWKATSQGDVEPDKIEGLFYDTLKEFDAEKINIEAFKQDLDITLSDLTGIDASNLMLEIGAILSNSEQSLKYKPNALKENQDDLKERGLMDSPENSNPQNQLPRTSNAQETDKPKEQANPKATPPSSEQSTSKPHLSSVDPLLGSNESTSQNSEKNISPLEPVITEPKSIETLIEDLCSQAKKVENLSPRPLGLSICTSTEGDKINFHDHHIYYEMMDFFDDQMFLMPSYGQKNGDIATMIWWQLVKYSRHYIDHQFSYTEAILYRIPSYIVNAQQKHKQNHILEAVLEWENNLLFFPDVLKECQKLQMIQSELMQLTQPNQQLSQ